MADPLGPPLIYPDASFKSTQECPGAEFYASYLHLSMSSYCDSVDLPGSALWLRIQSQEGYAHAMNLFHFVQVRQRRVTPHPISQPNRAFGSVLEVMWSTPAHQGEVSILINRLYVLASDGRAYSTQVHLQVFISEQLEEKKIAADIIAQFKMICDNGGDLLILAKELALRQLTRGL